MGRRIVVTIVAAGVCLAVGGGVGLWLSPPTLPDVVAQPTAPSVVAVTSQPYADPRTVQASATVAPTRAITSAAAGVVRATWCIPGTPVNSGAPLLLVDDRTVLALHLEAPPWRDLALGVRGTDVSDLQRELTRLGYTTPVTGVYSATTGQQVSRLWAAAGTAKLNTVPLSQVAWLPDSTEQPTTCPEIVGQTRAAGDVAFTVGGELQQVTAIVPTTAVAGDREATIQGADVRASVGADGAITDQAFLSAFAHTQGYQQWVADPTHPLTVTTELTKPLDVVAVPPAALYNITGSHGCVLQVGGVATEVTIVASQLGQTFVTATPIPTAVMVTAPQTGPACA